MVMEMKWRYLMKFRITTHLPGDQEGLFKLAVQLRKFSNRPIL
jgi:hypothetical protein